MKDILRAIEKQIEKNKHLNLLYDHVEDMVQIDPYFAQVLANLHRHRPWEMEDLISQAVEKTLSALYAVNQFLSITPERKEELRRIYQVSWEQYDPARPSAFIRAHHARLSRWVTRLYPDNLKDALRTRERIGRLTDARYSADFQIRVLGLDLDGLMEPIIDLGCGPQASLVHCIRARGKDALGIDRKIEGRSDHAREISWFEFNFEPGTYGTIIANMSFTNHLLFHLSNGTEEFPKYLLKYKEILESLKPGGMFVYAPSLPLIEERLDDRENVAEIREKGKDAAVVRIRRLR